MLVSTSAGRPGRVVLAALAIAFAWAIGPAAAQPLVTDEMLLTAHLDPNNWLMAGRDYAGTRFSP